jgi:hypothetical protein
MKYRELFLLIQSFVYEITGYECFPVTGLSAPNMGKKRIRNVVLYLLSSE